MRALAQYPGPTQNFTLAQTDGRAAFSVAGAIPNDPAWGLAVVNGARAPAAPLAFVPFAQLPHVAPARDALAVNSNNVAYGAGYPYRLGRVLQCTVSRGRDRPPPPRAAEDRRRSVARHSGRHDVAGRGRTRAHVRDGAEEERRGSRPRHRTVLRRAQRVRHLGERKRRAGFERRDRHSARALRCNAGPHCRAHERCDRQQLPARWPGVRHVDACAARTPARLVSAQRSIGVSRERGARDGPALRRP